MSKKKIARHAPAAKPSAPRPKSKSPMDSMTARDRKDLVEQIKTAARMLRGLCTASNEGAIETTMADALLLQTETDRIERHEAVRRMVGNAVVSHARILEAERAITRLRGLIDPEGVYDVP